MSSLLDCPNLLTINPEQPTTGPPATSGYRRYRDTLRRRIPEPFIVLLCFVWGVWIYDGWFGKNGREAGDHQRPEANEVQSLMLHSLDRSLRLGDALEGKPRALALFAGLNDRIGALEWAIEACHAADSEYHGLNPRARAIESILLQIAGQGNRTAPPTGAEASTEASLLMALSDPAQAGSTMEMLARTLGTPEARWWHLEVARRVVSAGGTAPATLAEAIRTEESKGETLLRRTLWARGAVALLTIAGFLAIPSACRLLRRATQPEIPHYPDRWPLALVVATFLIGELAGIGLTVAFGVLHSEGGELPVAALVPLDIVLRFLPAVIATAMLFHRPRHAAERLGLFRPFPVLPLLGLFSILMILNEGLLIALDRWIPVDPTGGIHAEEAGWSGFAFLLFSACLVAPVAEEYLYRGILFRGTSRRLGVIAAALASSFLFSLVHFYDVFGTASIVLLGFTCALAYRATGSLAAAIAFHAFYNLSVTVPEWIIHHSPL